MDISELDFTGYSMVERNPTKLSGTPILRGSRMPAQGIIENYVDGYTPDEIADLFQLPHEGVRALVAEAVARNPACGMNIFFDNNVPAPLRHHLGGHAVKTAWEMGWHEFSNGTLLTAAENAGFSLMITGDKNLAYQQNLKNRKISLIVSGTTRWRVLKEDLQPVLGAILRAKPNSYEQLPEPPYVARKKKVDP